MIALHKPNDSVVEEPQRLNQEVSGSMSSIKYNERLLHPQFGVNV